MDLPSGNDDSPHASTSNEELKKGSEVDAPEDDMKAVGKEGEMGETVEHTEAASIIPTEAELGKEATTKSTEKQVENEGDHVPKEDSPKDLQGTSNGHDHDNNREEVHQSSSGHQRSTSKVEVIEAPNRETIPSGNATRSVERIVPANANLHADPAQHRHDSRTDHPSSYQPSPPRNYLHLRAVALQLPNNTTSATNANHIDPPTIVLEGRTNLSSARRSFYPKVTRTLPELHLWLLALTLSFPASIFSPFTYPLPILTSGAAPSDASIRNYLVTITNQLGRILIKPYVLSHPATVALVDCDFNYTPTLPHIGPGSSPLARKKMEEGLNIARAGFDPLRGRKGKGSVLSSNGVTSTWDVDGVAAALGLPTAVYAANHDTPTTSASTSSSKNPLSLFSSFNSSPQRIQNPPPVALPPGEEDEDEEDLTLARNEITRLEMQFEKASRAAEIVVERGGSLNATLNQLTQALGNLERLDSGRIIAKRSHEEEIVGAMIRGIEGWSAAEAGASSTILSTIAPSMAYQSLNARMAIDALLRRAAAATHRHSALVVLVQKRREAERLKRARGEIRQEEVDWVLNELKEAQRTTQILTHHLATFTATLKDELKNHSRFTHSDVQANLLNHARNSIRAHKFMLGSLCRARDDLMAQREGKAVKDVPPTSSTIEAVSSGPIPVEAVIQEEELSAPIPESEGAVDQRTTTEEEQIPASPAMISPKPDVPESDRGAGLASSASSTSRDKALPNAPVEGVTPLTKPDEEELIPERDEMTTTEVHSPIREPEQSQNVRDIGNGLPISATSPSSQETALQPGFSSSGVTQSGFLPTSNSSGHTERPPPMAQSAFLPPRNIDRYANPFARLDPSLSNSTPPSQAPPSVPTSPGSVGKVKTNDVWANRSRLSASDAARSLAGRF